VDQCRVRPVLIVLCYGSGEPGDSWHRVTSRAEQYGLVVTTPGGTSPGTPLASFIYNLTFITVSVLPSLHRHQYGILYDHVTNRPPCGCCGPVLQKVPEDTATSKQNMDTGQAILLD